jgi:hypothetical protein
MVYDSLTQSPFLDIVHCCLMTHDVLVASSASGFSHFAVASPGQYLLLGAYTNKLTDPWCPVTEYGSICGVHQSRCLPCLKMEIQPASETPRFIENHQKETSKKGRLCQWHSVLFISNVNNICQRYVSQNTQNVRKTPSSKYGAIHKRPDTTYKSTTYRYFLHIVPSLSK